MLIVIPSPCIDFSGNRVVGKDGQRTEKEKNNRERATSSRRRARVAAGPSDSRQVKRVATAVASEGCWIHIRTRHRAAQQEAGRGQNREKLAGRRHCFGGRDGRVKFKMAI